MNSLETAILALLVLGYMLYRQLITRPVTRRDLLLPLVAGIYLAAVYFGQPSSPVDVAVVVGAALFGIATGAVSAAVVRVWRDGSSGLVMQRGGWRYLLVLLGLIAVRAALHVALSALKLDTSEAALNDAFIGMAVGSYAGRAVLVGLRALALLGWDPSALPGRRDVRAIR